MSECVELIDNNFGVATNEDELSKATDFIEKLKFELKSIISERKPINDIEFVLMYNQIIRGLEYVGNLSLPAFAVRDKIEETYELKYRHAPELAKKLWYDHYEKIHHPYNILKNRCYRLLDDLDIYYEDRYKKKPPNWKG